MHRSNWANEQQRGWAGLGGGRHDQLARAESSFLAAGGLDPPHAKLGAMQAQTPSPMWAPRKSMWGNAYARCEQLNTLNLLQTTCVQGDLQDLAGLAIACMWSTLCWSSFMWA